eukprot:674406-Prymnesium_polylepis.1
MYARSFRLGPLGAWTWWISRAGRPGTLQHPLAQQERMPDAPPPREMTARASWWWRRWRWLREWAFGAAAA